MLGAGHARWPPAGVETWSGPFALPMAGPAWWRMAVFPLAAPRWVRGGIPCSRHLCGPWVAGAAGRGLRLVSCDRPGYGGSMPCPGYGVAGCAGDVRAICVVLEIDRLVMWGISGGGPCALACAALLPELAAAAVSLAGSGPCGAEGLGWFAGMEPDDVDYNELALAPVGRLGVGGASDAVA